MPRWTNHSRALSLRTVSPTTENRKWPGSINPASKNRRNYWVNDGADEALTADEWLAGAVDQKGSWWPHWAEWLGQRSGRKIAAPKKPGNATYKEIEPAPGAYVKAKAT